MTTIQKIYRYCKERMEESGEDFSMHEFIAMHIIDEDKCTLQKADRWLYNRMSGLIQEYCDENGLTVEDYNAEEVFTDGFYEEEYEQSPEMSPEEEWSEHMSHVCESEYFNN